MSFIILLIDFLTEIDGDRKVEHEHARRKKKKKKAFLTGLWCVAVGDLKGNAHLIDSDAL